MESLHGIVGADWVWYNEADPVRGRISWVIDPLDTFPGAERVFAACMHEHPCLLHSGAVADGQSWRLSDFLPRTRLHRLKLYNEFYRRRRIEYQLGIRLSASRSRVIAVGVNRGPRRRDFSNDEMLSLDLLGPHLVEAYRNAEALSALRIELAAAGSIENLRRAAVIVTRGDVQWISLRARRLLERYVGWSVRRPLALPEPLGGWLSQQRTWLDRSDQIPSPRQALAIERGTGHLRVRLVADRGEAFLLLDERSGDLDPADLEHLGLTAREAEVLAWVARGKTNGDTAAILGARPATVAKHLERIFRKLGVETRTAAAARAFEAAAIR